MYEKRVLIETYWNVNLPAEITTQAFIYVLIETYWNVNINHKEEYNKNLRVLIETYWNVNFYIEQKIVILFVY